MNIAITTFTLIALLLHKHTRANSYNKPNNNKDTITEKNDILLKENTNEYDNYLKNVLNIQFFDDSKKSNEELFIDQLKLNELNLLDKKFYNFNFPKNFNFEYVENETNLTPLLAVTITKNLKLINKILDKSDTGLNLELSKSIIFSTKSILILKKGTTAFHELIVRGFYTQAKKLIQKTTFNPQLKGYLNFNMIRFLDLYHSRNLIPDIIKHPNYDPNSLDINLVSDLMYFIYKNDFQNFERLIQHKNIDVNLQIKNGDTALFVAILKGRFDFCEILLDRPDTDLLLKNSAGYSAMNIALLTKHFDIALQILSKLVLIYSNPSNNVELNKCKIEIKKFFLVITPLSINKIGFTNYQKSLLQTIGNTLIQEIEDLDTNALSVASTSYKFGSNKQNNTHLFLDILLNKQIKDSLQKKLLYIVELKKIDFDYVDINGMTPLFASLVLSNEDLSLKIIDTIKETINQQLVTSFIKQIDIYLLFTKKSAPIHMAIFRGFEKLQKKILDHPFFDPNIQDQHGTTLIQYCINTNHKHLIPLIINHPKYDPTLRDNDSMTDLIYLILNNSFDNVKILLENPFLDVNQALSNGQTPLMICINNDKKEFLKLILKNNEIFKDLDFLIQNINQQTVLSIALMQKKFDFVLLIFQKIAHLHLRAFIQELILKDV